MLELAKKALRITTGTEAYDYELQTLIDAAQTDLGIAGVTVPPELDAIVQTAIITYCKIHFGVNDNYDRLKASYDEQKAQLVTATGYTDWTVSGEANNV